MAGFRRSRRRLRKLRKSDCMAEKEMIKVSIEEFSRLQTYMLASEKDSDSYKLMKDRYIELKVILTSFGINLTEIDKIKE